MTISRTTITMLRCGPIRSRMLENRRGHCSDYHGFCAAMGRALGYPTRSHLWHQPVPQKLALALQAGGVPAALRLGQLRCFRNPAAHRRASRRDAKLAGRTTRNAWRRPRRDRLTSGFRDNTWFCVTRGTDYDLAPPPAAVCPSSARPTSKPTACRCPIPTRPTPPPARSRG